MPEFLRTHPPVSERIARLNQLITQHGMASPASQTVPLRGSGGSIWPSGSPEQTQRTEIEILPLLPVLP